MDELVEIVRGKIEHLPPEIARTFVNDLAERFQDSELGRMLRDIAAGLG